MRRAWLLVAGLGACAPAPEHVPLSFRKCVIDPAFRSEGVTVFDVDRDGHLDLVTEEQWYAGPGFAAHELRTPRAWDPLTEYATGFGAFHLDVDRDGFEDLIVFHFPGSDASWCRNPDGADQHWACHVIAPVVYGESPLLTTELGGEPALVMGVVTSAEPQGVIGAMVPDVDPELPWRLTPMTPTAFPQAAGFGHGLGLGDLDRDGRPDLITGVGWFGQPAAPATAWTFHPVEFCPNNCAHMFAYDFNGDGWQDVVGTSPHNYGAWWWEHVPTSGGDPTFIQHEIDVTNSQNHAARLVDLDADGVPELITGKRYWAHFDQDAGAHDPVVLVVYRHRLEAGTVIWDRIVIDDDSGVGSHQLEVSDVDADGKPDIVVSSKKGLSLFLQD